MELLNLSWTMPSLTIREERQSVIFMLKALFPTRLNDKTLLNKRPRAHHQTKFTYGHFVKISANWAM